MSPSLQLSDALSTACTRSIRRAADFFMKRQHADGYWSADLTADSTLESDYILLELWRHAPVNGVWNPPTKARIEKSGALDSGAAAARRRLQYLSAGSFGNQTRA